MKKTLISLIALILATVMLCSVFASCGGQGNSGDQTESSGSSSETNTEKNTEKETDKESESDDSETTGESNSDETDETTEEITTDPIEDINLEGPFASSIQQANKLSDGVQAYFVDAARKNYRVINKNMTLDYALVADQKLVSSIKNTKGQSYIENTMDVFITMDNGKTYYAGSTNTSARPNIYKVGYYYYDIHFLDQDFNGDAEISSEFKFESKSVSGVHDVKGKKLSKDGVVSYTVSGSDPYVYTTSSKSSNKLSFNASDYNAVQFTMKTTSSTNGELYFIAGSYEGHNANQKVGFTLEADGEFHTYTVFISGVEDYKDKVTSLRFDVGTSGEYIELKDIKAVKIESEAPPIYLDRNLHTYSDKMNQVLHFVTKSEVSGIKAMGMITEIAKDTVDKLIVKDAKGTHTSIDDVDWNTAEYIGFDIKGVGVFGYILLAHENSGKLEVTLSGDNYVIKQSSAPKDGKMIPSNKKVTYTKNDFYMGHRIYTDENHSFDAFLIEAENERHPLETISGSNYEGYDALRGAYKFTIGGTGFNEPFFTSWNRHYTSDVSVTGGKSDRQIYIYTYYDGGCGEGAIILDNNNMALPIPVMIYKNFGGEDEEPLFNAGDHTYSETYFPFVVNANKTSDFTVLNLYMNWGAFPLKQLSSIQYFWPYYHLSLGTTETSCISPWYGARDLWTLPDFRSMSMPYWFELEGDAYSNQPQHTHGGYQYFLQYTDSEGNYSASENINNDIDASGPVYAEVTMDYISDDGRIKVSYTHVELPQTDELRAYYEIKYEILEDITIKDFRNNFSFYSFEGYAGHYTKMGYLDENNKPAGKATNSSSTPEITKLGSQSPYVSLYNLSSSSPNWAKNNVNLGFVIYDSDITINGEKCDDKFVIVGKNYVYSLSLDLDEATLKAGDTMTLDMIISPWGWYDSKNDQNIQDIRANTCLDPLKLTVNEGEDMNSTYVPKIKSTNGESVEFTLSGASNNVVARVYGINKLTVPKIYEKVNGEWVEYVVCSINNPDKLGLAHYYDGYSVFYDGNGTYSYAFAINMDDVDSRTFKFVADEDFKKWPDDQNTTEKAPLNVLVGPEMLEAMAQSNTGIGSIKLSDAKDYVSFYGENNHPEAFFNAFVASDDEPTGQYLVIKYRMPSTVTESAQFQVFTSTVNGGAAAADNFYLVPLTKDNNWHIIIADLTKQGLPTFTEQNGKYFAKYLRLDIFNAKMAETSYIDIAYIGISDSLENICKLNDNKGTAVVSERGQNIGNLNLATGKIETAGSDSGNTEDPEEFIGPDSGWTKSDVAYKSAIDFINGLGDGDGAYDMRGGNSKQGIDTLNLNIPTVGNAYLAIAGWTMVYEGVEKYMWSADGGKTWTECVLYNRDSFATITKENGIVGNANGFFGVTGYDSFEYSANSVYQGALNSPSGIAAHLTDYVGKTVNVIFAAVPSKDPDGLCLIAYLKNVRVYASDEEAEEGEKIFSECNHISAEKSVFIANDDNSDEALVSKTCKCGTTSFGTSAPKYVFYFQNIIGNKDSGNKYSSCENSKGYRVITVGDDGLKADSNKCIEIDGWGGLEGGCDSIVFQVYKADGTQLTEGWTELTSSNIYPAVGELQGEMSKRGIETQYGTRFMDLKIDLTEYFAKSDTVTVKLAMVADGAAEFDNRYVYLCELTGIKAN